MKFSPGDPVYIKSNDEEGVILEMIDAVTAKVRAGGVAYHVNLEDLEHPYLRWFLNKKTDDQGRPKYGDQIHKEKNFKRQQTLPDGIHLVFMPEYTPDFMEDKVTKFKIFLYNETPDKIEMDYDCRIKSDSVFAISSLLYPHSEFYLHDLSFEDAANSPAFVYKLVLADDIRFEAEDRLALKPKKLFDRLAETRYANQPLFSFLLRETIEEKKAIEVVKTYFATSPSKSEASEHFFDFEKARKETKYEVDLHIEKLTKNYQHLGNSEILEIQMAAFKKALDLAIATHQYALVLIHGVGKGVLKNEIHKHLNQTNHVKNYVNAYDIRYGFGATEVFFKY
ncbi:MAG: Smr/MutS family protein [Chitinophagaceae bacterium]|nr:Smr/MutS family protein [Chitinophagaceae bacterium]